MFLSEFQKEWKIRGTLRKLSKQRVAAVLQPGNVWVIENTVKDNEQTDTDLKTCFMRGWVEPIEEAIPKGKLTPEGELPNGNIFDKIGIVYRVTDSGWSVINRSHHWAMIAVFLSGLTLIITLGQ